LVCRSEFPKKGGGKKKDLGVLGLQGRVPLSEVLLQRERERARARERERVGESDEREERERERREERARRGKREERVREERERARKREIPATHESIEENTFCGENIQ
jgi:hypothetical protein